MPTSTQFMVTCNECDEEILVGVIQSGTMFDIQPFNHECDEVIDDDEDDDDNNDEIDSFDDDEDELEE